jgi:hypothetical protein
MSNLNAKLARERDHLVADLSALAAALSELPVERLAEVMPAIVGIYDIVQRVRKLGVPVPGVVSDAANRRTPLRS